MRENEEAGDERSGCCCCFDWHTLTHSGAYTYKRGLPRRMAGRRRREMEIEARIWEKSRGRRRRLEKHKRDMD